MTTAVATNNTATIEAFTRLVESHVNLRLGTPTGVNLETVQNFLELADFQVVSIKECPLYGEGHNPTGWAIHSESGPVLNRTTGILVQLPHQDWKTATMWLVAVWEDIQRTIREYAHLPEPTAGLAPADEVRFRMNRQYKLKPEGHIAAMTHVENLIAKAQPLPPIVLTYDGDELHDLPREFKSMSTLAELLAERTRDTTELPRDVIGTHAVCGGLIKARKTTLHGFTLLCPECLLTVRTVPSAVVTYGDLRECLKSMGLYANVNSIFRSTPPNKDNK